MLLSLPAQQFSRRGYEAAWASTLLVAVCLTSVSTQAFSARRIQLAWYLRPLGGAKPLVVRLAPLSHGPILWSLVFTSRASVFLPFAAVAVSVWLAGQLTAHPWSSVQLAVVADVVTAYVPCLLVTAWELQDREHFRARASAAWQAARGAAMVRVLRETLHRLQPPSGEQSAAAVGLSAGAIAIASDRDGASLLRWPPSSRCLPLVSSAPEAGRDDATGAGFVCVAFGVVGPFADAAEELHVAARLATALSDVLTAVGLPHAPVVGGSGGAVVVRIDCVAIRAAGLPPVEVTAAVVARQTLRAATTAEGSTRVSAV